MRDGGRWRALAAMGMAALVAACGAGASRPPRVAAPSLPLGWSDAELVAYVTGHLDRLSGLDVPPDWTDDLVRVDGRIAVTSAAGTVFVPTRFGDDAAGHAAGDELCHDLAGALGAAADLPDPLHALVVTGEANATLAQCAPQPGADT